VWLLESRGERSRSGISRHVSRNPFGGEFTIACGLATAIDFVRQFQFQESEIEYLASQCGNDGNPLFDAGFLDYLRALRPSCDIDAMPEGSLVFPNEPLIRVCGPIIHCQLLENRFADYFKFSKPDRYESRAGLHGLLKITR